MNERIKKHYERIAHPDAIDISAAQTAKSLGKLYLYDPGLFLSGLTQIPSKKLIHVLLALSGDAFNQAIRQLQPPRLIDALKDIESDDTTDFLQRVEPLSPVLAARLVAALNPMERAEYHELSRYRDDEAGAYMQTELLKVTPDDTLHDVKARVRHFNEIEPLSRIDMLFVVDDAGILQGSLPFSDLILFNDDTTIQLVMMSVNPKPPITIRTHSPVEEVVRLFADFDLTSVGVVNKQGVLRGRILYDDVYDLIQDLQTEQAYSMAGVDDDAEEHSTTKAARARLIWLMVNLATVLLASLIIGLFEASIEQFVALAVLMPVVAALGGNAGMQALTVTIRRLALGEIDAQHLRPVLLREFRIVAINGLAVAASVSLVAYVWFQIPMLSLVIAVAMLCNLLIAGILGGLIPLLLKRTGIDPAVASTVMLTTMTDAFGFLIFLGLASLVFGSH